MKGCEPLTDEELARMVQTMAGRMVKRDKALLLLGTATGLRISELLSLRIGDVETESGALVKSFNVARRHTKGQTAGKTSKLLPPASVAVWDWLRDARLNWAAQRSWPLFCTSTGRRMSRFQAYKVLRRAMERAGVRHGVMGTHTMRKTMVAWEGEDCEARRLGGEQMNTLLVLKEITGHANIQQLAAYMATSDDTVQRTVRNHAQRMMRALAGTTAPPPPSPTAVSGPSGTP